MAIFSFVVSSFTRPVVSFAQSGSRIAGIPAPFGSAIPATFTPPPPPPSRAMDFVAVDFISASKICAKSLRGGSGKAIMKGITQKLVDDLEVELGWAGPAAQPFTLAALTPFTLLTGIPVPPCALVPPFYDEDLVVGPGAGPSQQEIINARFLAYMDLMLDYPDVPLGIPARVGVVVGGFVGQDDVAIGGNMDDVAN